MLAESQFKINDKWMQIRHVEKHIDWYGDLYLQGEVLFNMFGKSPSLETICDMCNAGENILALRTLYCCAESVIRSIVFRTVKLS